MRRPAQVTVVKAHRTTARSTYPNLPLVGTDNKGNACPSAVFEKTVLPHHFWIVLIPIVPFSGNWRVKKIRMVDMATPQSMAADRTSVQCDRNNVVNTQSRHRREE